MKRKITILSLILLLTFFANIAYAQSNEKVEVTIPKFDVKINGFAVDNQHNKYPMIVYKDTTYLPLTDGYCKALGLTTSWDSGKGYVIDRNYKYDAPKQDLSANNDLNIKYNAEISSFNISIKGKEVVNNQEEYPILFFRDTVYIPLTWRFANEFMWKLYWDNEDGLSLVGDAPDVYDTTIVGEWIYYSEDYDIFKIKLDGSEKTKFADAGICYEMIVLGDWIYYVNGSDENRLYKIKTDGTNKTKLSDGSIQELVGIEDWIYYISEQDYSYDNPNSLYKMRLDGSGETKIKNLKLGFLSFPLLKDGWIYYRNTEDYDKLYRIRTDGNDKTKLSDTTASGLQIVDDWIYYVDLSSNLYKVKNDGSDNTKVLDEKLYYYVIKGDYLYYGNEEDKEKLYKIKLDGTGKAKLNNDKSDPIDIIDEWVYYEGLYGVEMSCFLKFARTDINTGITENILPNGPENFYYADGIKIQGQYETSKPQNNNFYYDGQDKTTEELAQLSNSVVLINTYDDKGEPLAQGSGVVISEDGLIVTNLHVLSDSTYIGVIFEDMEEGYELATINILNADEEKDLALIKLHLDDTVPIRLGDSDDIIKGEKVIAIGNPYGLENTISDGIISGIRDMEGIEIIQTTTPISPGSSGGALLNMKGELLGITSMTNAEGQSLNFAIPTKYVEALLQEDITKLNMEISNICGVVDYNNSTLVFDGINYYQGDKYLINLVLNNEIEIDFNIFASSEEFKKEIEEFYTKNIQDIASKYDIKKYDFNLYAGRYVFSYKYDKGKISSKKWKEDKELKRSKISKAKVLRVNLGDTVDSLDPQLNSSQIGFHVINNIFEGLMREENGRLKYGMASKYTVSKDGRTYTFHLRNAKWSDGQSVKASDFEYSWKRALAPDIAADFGYQLFYIKGAQEYYEGTGRLEDVAIKAVDDKTLRVTLNEPVPYFPKLTTLPIYMPVRKDVIEEDPDEWFEDAAASVCNGPFRTWEYTENFKITLVKNKEYYDSKSIKLDIIDMYMINDSSISVGAYEADEFDVIDFMPSKEDEALYENEALKKIPVLGVQYYMFNVSKAPVNDVRVRKALSLAIDRKVMVDNVLGGTQIPGTGFVPLGIYTSNGGEFRDLAGDYQISVEKANVEEAKKLLAEAGYPGGKDFPELVLLYNETAGNKAIAETIKEMWEENLDIKVKLEDVKWAEQINRLTEGDFMIGRNGWIADYADAVNFLELFASDSAMFNTGWINGEYDKLIQDSYSASEKERDQMLLEAEKILMDEMVAIPLYYYADLTLIKEYIKDWQRTGLGYWYFRNTEIK